MKGKRDPARDFPGKRWLVNLLRAVHLVGVVGLGAGTALYLMSAKKAEKTATVPKRRGPRVDSVGVGYQSELVTGSF